MSKAGKRVKKQEFSKLLLVQESALIWFVTVALIALAYICIIKGYTGTLPWLSAMVALPWTAYAVSQSMYYSKSKAENTEGGLKYESVMAQLTQQDNTENINPWGPI